MTHYGYKLLRSGMLARVVVRELYGDWHLLSCIGAPKRPDERVLETAAEFTRGARCVLCLDGKESALMKPSRG